MQIITYIIHLIWRIKWWLILCPLLISIIVIYSTRNLHHSYKVETTLYSGNIYSNGNDITQNSYNSGKDNTIDNIISIIKSKSTLQKVSLRLYAEVMIHGDINKDNNYVKAENFRYIWKRTPAEVKKLIDKNSEEETIERLNEYAQKDTKNFLYGLFNWDPPFYSYKALKEIIVYQVSGTDIIHIDYSADDPGIAYHTLLILDKECNEQFEKMQYGETNNVISFFEEELAKSKAELNNSEDSLTIYNIRHKIINYSKQTEFLAGLQKENDMLINDVKQIYEGTLSRLNNLEKQITKNTSLLRENSLFVKKLDNISHLAAKITRMETFKSDSTKTDISSLINNKKILKEEEESFKIFTDSINQEKYTKNGYFNSDLMDQWLTVLLNNKEAEAKLKVLQSWEKEIERRYTVFAPIGSTLKKKERSVSFTESTYLELLHSLNTARMHQKNQQMSSGTLQILSPPNFPLASSSSKRKMMVLAAFFGSLFFVLGYFILMEIIDNTLRNKLRAEFITKEKIIFAWPGNIKHKYQQYSTAANKILSRYLGNNLLQFSQPGKTTIINLLSVENHEGKSYIGEKLTEYYQSIGFKVKFITYHNDFSSDSREFLLAKNIKDLHTTKDEEILIVEYPALQKVHIPQPFLTESSVNILITRAMRTWKNLDKIYLKNIKNISGNVPVRFVLNDTRREDAEEYTGLLPPYTKFRKFGYRMINFGLTSREK